jgi:hypothetical protein
MPKSECHERAQSLAEPLEDLGFMLSCYDRYGAAPPEGPAARLAEATREGDGE